MNDYAYAERFLDQVPRKWTNKRRIDLDFVVLETLVWAGKVKMAIRPLFGPNHAPRGCLHFFKRIA